MAAIFAAEMGAPVVLVDGTRDGGRKILISGGGRCNVLPSQLEHSRFISASSPNTLRKILRSWPLQEQRRFFEGDLGIPLVSEPDTGKLFPASNRARDVRDGLLDLARGREVSLKFGSAATGLRRPEKGEAWQVLLQDGTQIRAVAVILATGGLSVPQTGSDGKGFQFATRLGHSIHETYPALTPLRGESRLHRALAGVSLEVTLRAGRGRDEIQARGGFLFTHGGYSGPAVLDVSHVAVRGREPKREKIFVQWTEMDSESWDEELRASGVGNVGTIVRRTMPTRLADVLLEEAKVDPDRSRAQLRKEERVRLVQVLCHYELPWVGHEGYKKAEVTGGGVPLAEINSVTMESKVASGLFLCGEILDCFGPIGGYNFFWAWATGRAAGLGAAQFLKSASILGES
jgi:predicted Rossmann fold flavoprotein